MLDPDSTEIDIIADSDLWLQQPDAERIVRMAVQTAARSIPAIKSKFQVAVLLTDNAALQRLNRDFRNVDKPTNVLSFPSPQSQTNQTLGDIAIAYETLIHEAGEENKPFSAHLSHLAIHGFLHLLGYDHESEAEAYAMERLETDILAALNIANPYGTADAPVS